MTDELANTGTLESKLQHVDQVLSMVLHYDDVQKIAEALKEVIQNPSGLGTATDIEGGKQ